jgi:hypothetical protein
MPEWMRSHATHSLSMDENAYPTSGHNDKCIKKEGARGK